MEIAFKNQHYIKEVVNKLLTINPYRIILFGSYANGTPTDDSDIDILVITEDDFMPANYTEQLEYRLTIKKLIREISKKVPIDLLVYSKPMFEKFKGLNSSFAQEILTNGKNLYESNNPKLA